MTKVRYKIRKEQLERVVENFVMESAMIEKNAAKKHKMSMGAEQADDMGDGMEKAPEVKKAKMKQAPEVKKHIHGKVNESRMLRENIQDSLEGVDQNLLNLIAKKLKGVSKEEIKSTVEDAKEEVVMGEVKSGKLFKIGGTLLVAGLIGLGIEASLAERLANQLSDDVTMNMLNNAGWVASAISTIAGMVTSGVAVKKGYEEKEKEFIDNAKADGFTERGEDKLGRLIMTNPKTNKFRIYKG
jgi:hypothetical protein